MGLKTIDVASSKKDFIPGPGQYDTINKGDSRLKAEPKFSMGTGKRPDIANIKEKNNIPGPGNYSTMDDSVMKKTAPKFGFGTSKRDGSTDS